MSKESSQKEKTYGDSICDTVSCGRNQDLHWMWGKFFNNGDNSKILLPELRTENSQNKKALENASGEIIRQGVCYVWNADTSNREGQQNFLQ